MVSFLQDFDAPEFDEAHPDSIDPCGLPDSFATPSQLRDLIASFPPNQLPPCSDDQRLIFDDQAIPEGAKIVHSGYCGSKVAVIVELPRGGRWTSTSTR